MQTTSLDSSQTGNMYAVMNQQGQVNNGIEEHICSSGSPCPYCPSRAASPSEQSSNHSDQTHGAAMVAGSFAQPGMPQDKTSLTQRPSQDKPSSERVSEARPEGHLLNQGYGPDARLVHESSFEDSGQDYLNDKERDFSPRNILNPAGPQGKHPGSENEQSSGDNSEKLEFTNPLDKQELSAEERQILDELKQRDAEVRAHEQAHIAAGGQYITSGANYSYETGPDGRQYAVGGEVSIDTSPVPGNPEMTEKKAQTVRQAALAPAAPSAQDMNVAAQASQMEAEARTEKMNKEREEQEEQRNTAESTQADPFSGEENSPYEAESARINQNIPHHYRQDNPDFEKFVAAPQLQRGIQAYQYQANSF